MGSECLKLVHSIRNNSVHSDGPHKLNNMPSGYIITKEAKELVHKEYVESNLSTEQLAKNHHLNPNTVKSWARLGSWRVERNRLQEKGALVKKSEWEMTMDRYALLGKVIQQRAVKTLETYKNKDIPISQVPSFLKAGIDLERLGLGIGMPKVNDSSAKVLAIKQSQDEIIKQYMKDPVVKDEK